MLSKDTQEDRGLTTIAKGGFVNVLGLISAFVFNFIFQIILTRTLSTADVGLYNLGFTVAGLLGLLFLFGLDRTVVRFIAYFRGLHDQGRELGTIINSLVIVTMLAIFLTPIFWVLAEYISQAIFNKPEFTPVLRIFILSVPFVAVTRLLLSILQGYKKMKPMVLIEQIYIPIVRIISYYIILYAFGRASISASAAYLFASFTGLAIIVFYLSYIFGSYVKSNESISVYSELLVFSWPLFGASLLNNTNNQIEILFLGVFSTSEQIAIYTVALKTTITLAIFFQAFNMIFAPFIAESYGTLDLDRLSQQFKVITRWIFIFTLPFTLLLLLEAADIMAVFGEIFILGAPILRLLSLSQLVYAMVGPVALILTMTRYARLNLIDLLLTLIISIVLDLFLIPLYGAYGAAVANTITIILLNIVRLIQVYIIYRFQPYSKDYIWLIIAGAIASLVTIGCSLLLQDVYYIWRLFISSMLFLLVYTVVMFKWGINQTDWEAIDSIIVRLHQLYKNIFEGSKV